MTQKLKANKFYTTSTRAITLEINCPAKWKVGLEGNENIQEKFNDWRILSEDTDLVFMSALVWSMFTPLKVKMKHLNKFQFKS